MKRNLSKPGESEGNSFKDCRYSSHYTILDYETFEQPNCPYNPNTLNFKDPSLNKKLLKTLYCDNIDTLSPSKEFKNNLWIFYTFFEVILIIFLSFAILMYYSNDFVFEVFIFHMICISALMVTSVFGLVLMFKSKRFLVYNKYFFTWMSVMLLAYLVVGSGQVADRIFDGKMNRPQLPCTLTIVVACGFVRMILFDCYFLYVFICAFVSILYISINLSFGGYNNYTILSEFCILLIFLILSIVECQQVDLRTKQLFWRIFREEQAINEMLNDGQELDRKQTLLSLTQRCRHVKAELKHISSVIMYRDLKNRLKSAIHNLSFIEKNINYDQQQEYFEISQDDNLDEEDKQFITQNYVNSSPTKSKRRNVKSLTIIDMPEKKISYVLNNNGLSECADLLGTIGKNWNFDIWGIVTASGGHSIFIIGKYLFEKWDFAEVLKTSEYFIDNFFLALEKSYKDNPYHNSTHGADVCASLVYFILQSNLCKSISPQDSVVSIIASLGHDVGHPGVTNRFLINSKDLLALQYNDISVLENMHCSTIYSLLEQQQNNFLTDVPYEEWLRMRKLMIDMILETDMSRHFEIMNKFRGKLLAFSLDNADDKGMVLGMGLKCADIGHSAKDLELHNKWTQLVCEEFFRQGDVEKSRKQAVSMYCDRETTDIPKSQAGFLKNICLPLYDLWCTYLTSEIIVVSCLKQLEKNHRYWDNRYKEKKSTPIFKDLPEIPIRLTSFSASPGSLAPVNLIKT